MLFSAQCRHLLPSMAAHAGCRLFGCKLQMTWLAVGVVAPSARAAIRQSVLVCRTIAVAERLLRISISSSISDPLAAAPTPLRARAVVVYARMLAPAQQLCLAVIGPHQLRPRGSSWPFSHVRQKSTTLAHRVLSCSLWHMHEVHTVFVQLKCRSDEMDRVGKPKQSGGRWPNLISLNNTLPTAQTSQIDYTNHILTLSSNYRTTTH